MSCPFVIINCTAETFTAANSGAIAAWISGICSAAASDGREPLVITRSSPHQPVPWPRTLTLDYPKIPSARIPNRLLKLRKTVSGWGHVREAEYNRRILQALTENGLHTNPLVLHNGPELAVFLRRALPEARIIHLFHGHNTCDSRFRRRFPKSVDVACGVSQFTAGWNSAYFQMPVRTLYNGVDVDHFQPRAERPSGPSALINFVGLTDVRKGPDLVVDAALRLAQERKDFAVRILGSNRYGYDVPDPYGKTLQRKILALEQQGIVVEAPGFIARAALSRMLREADINVVPSRIEEPFGLVVLEGMASGLATVAADVGGIPEIVADAGILIPSDNVSALADALRRLLGDRVYLRAMQQSARDRARAFTWHNTYRRLLALIAQTSRDSAPPTGPRPETSLMSDA